MHISQLNPEVQSQNESMFNKRINMKNKYEIIIGTAVLLAIVVWSYVVLALWVGTQPHIWKDWNPGVFGDSFGVLACVFSAGAFVYSASAFYNERRLNVDRAKQDSKDRIERVGKELAQHLDEMRAHKEERALHRQSIYIDALARAFDHAVDEVRERFDGLSKTSRNRTDDEGDNKNTLLNRIAIQLEQGHFNSVPIRGESYNLLRQGNYCLEPLSTWLDAATIPDFEQLDTLHTCYSRLLFSVLGVEGQMMVRLYTELDERWPDQNVLVEHRRIAEYVKKYNLKGWERVVIANQRIFDGWKEHLVRISDTPGPEASSSI